MATQYHFTMRSGPTVGKTYPLDAQEITIGRDAVNTITINDAEVSRKHARMELRGSAYVIQDLGSTNGTFVNGTRVSAMQVLNPGDTVAFGEGIVLVYEPAAGSERNDTFEQAPPGSSQATAQSPSPSHSQTQPRPKTGTCLRTRLKTRAGSPTGLLRQGAGWPGADAARSSAGKEKIPGVGHYCDRSGGADLRLHRLLRGD